MRWSSSPGTLRTLAVSLYKIANDIRLMSCGPRAGFAELHIPENEPGSSIMPGKVNPTQAEALTMIAVQVMANDVAVGFGGAGGYLEMNVYKPLMIFNIAQSITILSDGCTNFRKFLIEGTKPNLKKIAEYVERSLMLVTALSPVIGYDKASKIAHYAMDHDLTLKAAALQLGFVITEAEFDRVVDPAKMVHPYLAEPECMRRMGQTIPPSGRANTLNSTNSQPQPWPSPATRSNRRRTVPRRAAGAWLWWMPRERPVRRCCSACGCGPRSVSPSTSRSGSNSTMRIGPALRRRSCASRSSGLRCARRGSGWSAPSSAPS